MSVMITEVYQALRAIDVPEDLATRAAEAVGQHHDRLAKIEGRLSVLEWMAGANILLTLSMLGVLWGAIWSLSGKVTDLAQQIGMLAGRLH